MAFDQYAEPRNTSMVKLLEKWNESTAIEKDVHVIVAGGEGDGKSQTSCKFVQRIPDANLWDNVVYTSNPKELMDKYNNMQKRSVMVLDEALNSISRADWNNADVKAMVKFFRTVVRKEKQSIWFYNTQLLRDMHAFWRNHRCTWLIEMGIREFYDPMANSAFVFQRFRVPVLTGKRDAWLLDSQEVIWLGKMMLGKFKGSTYASLLRGHPFYYGEMSIGKLPDSQWEEYHKNRAKAYAEYRPDEEMPLTSKKILKLQNREKLLMELLLDNGVEQREIALKLGITPQAVSKIKQQAQKTTLQL